MHPLVAYAIALSAGWLIGKFFKTKPKPTDPNFKSLMEHLLSKADYGAMVIGMCDPNEEKRKRADADKKLIAAENLVLGTDKKVLGERISLQRLLELAQAWDDASDEERKEVNRWVELVT